MPRFAAALSLLLVPLGAVAADLPAFRNRPALYADDKEGPLRHPEGVACGEGSLVVADTANGRLVIYRLDEGVPRGGTEVKVPQLPSPLRVQVGGGGEIYALDGKSRRIVRLGGGGEFLGYVDADGLPGPERMVPRALKLGPGGELFVLDLLGERVVVLAPTGRFVRQIPFDGKGRFFSDLAVTAAGRVLLLDSVNGVVLSNEQNEAAFAPLTEKLHEYVSFASGLEVDARDNLFLTDQAGGRIVAFRPDGSFLGQVSSMGWKAGLLNHPTQTCFLRASGDLAVADRNNNRIQLFLTGR